ncbi:hypothetical protein E2562_005231 [Oryza meyeriana var. granulata]|uniref:Uncharacterized protein n=1 Tax=Oryza meyeriana var. granulata TaxID=110450 RepID=A0A6G1EES1_9ORYZ|nr:hypothetical protein E2562_005231 [Oryza meyeriana var. granulata]
MSATAPALIPITTISELGQHHSQLVRLGLASHPDHFTFLHLLPTAPLPLAAQLHTLLLKLNYHSHTQSLAAYLAGARPDLASLLFRTSSCGALNVVSWTTMLLELN